MTQVKLCGLMNERDARFACSLGVDMVGLVFCQKSHRNVSVDTAKSIAHIVHTTSHENCVASYRKLYGDARHARTLSGARTSEDFSNRLKVVAVLRDAPIQFASLLVQEGIADILQLHGNEDATYVEKLRMCVDVPLIQAFRITDAKGVKDAMRSPADMVLVDGGAGDGIAFDWRLLDEVERPFILAGGLSPENVYGALEQVSPWAVDVSSGIETERKKDPDKMHAFVEAVRVFDNQLTQSHDK